ncbi:hypothetical protein IW261DRAFT_1598238 [Armillaria novae-zelandiae]|uniref:Uncharacterized protein n=1 Tax=Armillaria novae-zelandiae TaxID=153914 RepID=A0AA39NKN4_9AGAR|nr:hypothetical protein IW261DRAFT_1598238 [Armillaria novae-zelandiae]
MNMMLKEGETWKSSKVMDFWCSLYNGRVDIPSDLTDNDKASMFQDLDAYLNSMILYALLHGIYTGITAVTLWNISHHHSGSRFGAAGWFGDGAGACKASEENYFDTIALIAKGVAPTLLIGRAAVGHTRPNDDDDSTASSEASTTSYREPTIESSVYEVDIEAQQEQGEELIEVVERTE